MTDDAPAAPTDDAAAEEEVITAPAKRRKTPATAVLEWLVVVGVALLSALVVQRFVVQQFVVDGHSMDTTLHNGDRVLVNKISYHLHDPRRGDVVVLKRFEGNQAERDLIKRVVGLPGETIQIRDCVVYIDGRALQEPYLDDRARDPATCGSPNRAAQELVIPSHSVFVLGDNRGGSGDSRIFGAIDEDLLIGRAFVVIWPLGDWRWL
jgi:signal peptidase I